MASVEELISQVSDDRLRSAIDIEVRKLKSSHAFGLVYESHIPEFVEVPTANVSSGSPVRFRDPRNPGVYVVTNVTSGGAVQLDARDESHSTEARLHEIVPLKRFGEAVYPTLELMDEISSGTRPHVVINSDNLHALQLLEYTHASAVDVIYIDPPYNTGARDWKYNNNYVDGADAWRHSKWLAFMERRLRLSRKLLKPDGVLIVTIDEHEVHALGMLLEDLFPDFNRQMVTIVINPKGTAKANLARVEEYAFFCSHAAAGTVVRGRPRPDTSDYQDIYLRRRGQQSSHRHQRPNQFYALMVDLDAMKVVGVGPLLGEEDSYPEGVDADGLSYEYPIDTKGQHRVWRYSRETMEEYISRGEIVVWEKRGGGGLVFNHRKPTSDMESNLPIKTVWWDTRHDAGTHGSNLLNEMFGRTDVFPFPKSLYAVADALAAVVRDRPDAVILDFFAGSGTTLHATALLNAQLGGNRQCLLVTNNEVPPDEAKNLAQQGFFPGDDEYERAGIFWDVTVPRCRMAIEGAREDGTALEGDYIDEDGEKFRTWSKGFEDGAQAFSLKFLEPSSVEAGAALDALIPLLWLKSGARDGRPETLVGKPFAIDSDWPFAILIDETQFVEFAGGLADVLPTHVFIVTDSNEAFRELTSRLPEHRSATMLYRDYLSNFRVTFGGVS